MRLICLFLLYFFFTICLAVKEALNEPSHSSPVNGAAVINSSSVKAGSHIVSHELGAPIHEHLQEEQLMPEHMGREHVIEPSVINSTTGVFLTKASMNKTIKTTGSNLTQSTLNKPLPNKNATENKPLPKKKHVVPKKEVSLSSKEKLPSYNSTTKLISNEQSIKSSNVSANASSVVHKKPLILESDSDSSVEQQTESKKAPIIISQIDPNLLNSKPRRADYIIPIIGVIFSVPVVAFLISLIYKRGADWWRYRNYKRMDFLIEGMYQ